MKLDVDATHCCTCAKAPRHFGCCQFVQMTTILGTANILSRQGKDGQRQLRTKEADM
jgi:hypothetical protein